ncbi:MAG: Lmo0850 family protein [Staphylococcus simulans]|nr:MULTISPECIES: Lmo0850 family protein [Staphylococcus]MDK7927564.1 Lmo0850 family protein [Staphylococcus simulans]MDK8316229.1 Lmo0850 family protein [Staphylococcus simulans]MDU7037242.1 Lmo0850 family protein [Staphylococcus simulans]
MNNNTDKLRNVVQLLSSLGVNIKKTKSRLEIMHKLPNTSVATPKLK